MWAFVVHRWHHVRCGVAAYNIPAFALVSTSVRTLLPLCAIPWCAYVSLPVPTPFRVLYVLVPLYYLCKKRGPSFLFLSLLPGWFHTFVGLGWWHGPGARCFSRVRGVARRGNILAWLPPFPHYIFV